MFNLKNFVAVAVLILGGLTVSNAQIVEGSAVKIAIPNAFVLRGETFEPGVYSIARTPIMNDSPSLLILRGEGQSMVFDTMIGGTNSNIENTRLVFDTIDGVNYLSEILVKGQSGKNSIVPSKAQTLALTSSVSRKQTVLMIADTGF